MRAGKILGLCFLNPKKYQKINPHRMRDQAVSDTQTQLYQLCQNTAQHSSKVPKVVSALYQPYVWHRHLCQTQLWQTQPKAAPKHSPQSQSMWSKYVLDKAVPGTAKLYLTRCIWHSSLAVPAIIHRLCQTPQRQNPKIKFGVWSFKSFKQAFGLFESRSLRGRCLGYFGAGALAILPNPHRMRGQA